MHVHARNSIAPAEALLTCRVLCSRLTKASATRCPSLLQSLDQYKETTDEGRQTALNTDRVVLRPNVTRAQRSLPGGVSPIARSLVRAQQRCRLAAWWRRWWLLLLLLLEGVLWESWCVSAACLY